MNLKIENYKACHDLEFDNKINFKRHSFKIRKRLWNQNFHAFVFQMCYKCQSQYFHKQFQILICSDIHKKKNAKVWNKHIIHMRRKGIKNLI